MGLECSLCGAKLTALDGVRCRQCRRLVCNNCVKGRSQRDGAVCRECNAPPPASSGASEDSSLPRPASRWRRRAGDLLHAWRWLVFGLMLALLFLAILFRPVLRAKYFAARLASEDAGVAIEARETLARTRGQAVFKEMQTILLSGSPAARERAVWVLGEGGYAEALPMLRIIAEDRKESARMRAAAREAIVKIEELQP
jgi:HEAT repeat protein